MLKRPADPGGLTFWRDHLAQTGQLPTLWGQLAGSTEYFNNAQAE